MALKIITLGVPALLLDDQTLDTQFGVKARALLIYTALQSRPVPREQLAALFWKDHTQERASGNLRMTLMSLRDHLGEHAKITRSDVEIHCWSDVHQMQETLEALTSVMSGAIPWTSEHIQRLEQALLLYKGHFLHNFSVPDAEQFELWAHSMRESLRRQFFKAAEALIQYHEQREQYAEGLHWSSTLLKLDPLYEPAYRSLMRLYVGRGERILAIREYETCKRLLAAELSVEPDAETRLLYEQVVEGTHSHPTARPAASVTVMPKRPAPHNIPAQLTPLIGRTAELAALKALLNEARMITIVGTGGIGKTRLAIELGTQLVAGEAYPDGIYFVDLSSIQYHTQVVGAVANVLDIVESHQLNAFDQVGQHLKHKRLLLILDNFEHVLEAACEIEDWLKRAAHLTIIVTSREPLHLYAEYVYPVPALPDDDARSLFSKRVNAVKAGFAMTEDNTPLIEAICTRLEGLPLAIELAASQAHRLSPHQILQGLDNSLNFLRSPLRGGLDRQRTMYGAIEWSYQLLMPDEQALYRLVSIFVGGWTAEAVEALGGELAILLPNLVAKNLVQMTQDEPPRFRMLESIREHARQKLVDHNEVDLFAQAHVLYFTGFAEEARRGMWTNEQTYWFGRLEAERDNLRTAIDYADQHVDLTEHLCRIVAVVGYWYYARGYLREGHDWIEKALQKRADMPLSVQADLLASAGHLAHGHADYALADVYHSDALKLYLALEDWTNSAFMTCVLSVRETDKMRALTLTEEAYHLAKRTNDSFVLLNVANSYAVSLEQLGYMEQARDIFEDIIRSGKHLENETLQPVIVFNLGCVYREMGRLDDAVEKFEEAIRILRGSYIQVAFPNVLEETGDLYYGLGHLAQAATHYDEAFSLAEEMAAEMHLRRSHRAKAMMAWRQQDRAQVIHHYKQAFEGLIHPLPPEDWHSFSLGLFHLAEIMAAEHQWELAALLLGGLHQHSTARKIRLCYVHRQIQEQALQRLQAGFSEAQMQAAFESGKALSEQEMFAYALSCLDVLRG